MFAAFQMQREDAATPLNPCVSRLHLLPYLLSILAKLMRPVFPKGLALEIGQSEGGGQNLKFLID
jgi:hypothetical protein